jgi:serine/threonine-protein kinase ATR
MLGHLQSTGFISANHVIDATLPSEGIDNSMFVYEGDAAPSNPIANCTYPMRFGSEGISHVASILSVLAEISVTAVTSYDATPAFQDYMAWMLDSILTAYEQRKRVHDDSELSELCQRLDIASFCSLGTLNHAMQPFLSSTIFKKACTILSIFCADFIEKSYDLIGEVPQFSLCRSLLHLAAVCKEHYSLIRIIQLHLVPAIQLAMEEESRSSSLGNDFKVCILRLTLSYTFANLEPESCFHITNAVPC